MVFSPFLFVCAYLAEAKYAGCFWKRRKEAAESKIRREKMRHICKWTALGICGILAVLTVLLVLPGLFHIYPLIVQSGSMEPAYPVGSMIYVKKVEADALDEGMAVTFRLSDGDTLVTHRIVAIDMQKGEIYTKGDANELEDGAATPFSRIVGCPFFCIPGLGYVAKYLSSPIGKAGILFLVIMVCLLSWMEGALHRNEKEVREG